MQIDGHFVIRKTPASDSCRISTVLVGAGGMNLLARMGGGLVQAAAWVAGLAVGDAALFLFAGPGRGFGIVWWLVNVGLFMLWQPFVHAERRLGFSSCPAFC